MIFGGDQVGFGRLAEALRADLGHGYGGGSPRRLAAPYHEAYNRQ
ncbi:hypothetical protein ACU4GD_28000 [Cupriavidus basilensis]